MSCTDFGANSGINFDTRVFHIIPNVHVIVNVKLIVEKVHVFAAVFIWFGTFPQQLPFSERLPRVVVFYEYLGAFQFLCVFEDIHFFVKVLQVQNYGTTYTLWTIYTFFFPSL